MRLAVCDSTRGSANWFAHIPILLQRAALPRVLTIVSLLRGEIVLLKSFWQVERVEVWMRDEVQKLKQPSDMRCAADHDGSLQLLLMS